MCCNCLVAAVTLAYFNDFISHASHEFSPRQISPCQIGWRVESPMKIHFWFSKSRIEQWVNNLAHKNITMLQKLWTLKINHLILRSVRCRCIHSRCMHSRVIKRLPLSVLKILRTSICNRIFLFSLSKANFSLSSLSRLLHSCVFSACNLSIFKQLKE